MIDRAFLDRFLAAPLDEDVRAWALALIFATLKPAVRKVERDRWLRAAGALVPGAGWTRAKQLYSIAIELGGSLPTVPDTSTARGCVAMALLLTPGRVPCLRTIGRVVDKIV